MDKIIENALNNEIKRQQNNIELIASENYVSKDILKQRDQDYQTSSLDLALSANNLNLDGFSFQ